MAKELIVTSVPKGLFPGTYGFCIVAIDQTINEKTARSLEAISGYRQIESSVKPIAFSYYEYAISGEKVRVLSRVEDAGLDYSNRTNKLARHLILSAPEVLALSSGPATVCASPRTFARWTPNDSPRYLPSRPIQNPVNFSARSVKLGEWNRLTGDPGWAGLLASTVATERPVNLVVKPECNVLRLYEEALALLPPDKRWKATFSTYYTTTPPDVRCQWKALVEGAYDDKVLNNRRALLIDLTGGELGPVEQIGDPQTLTNDAKALVEIARGKRSLVAAPTRRGERESEAGLHLLEDDDTADFYSSINEGVRATRGSREALRNATGEFRDPNEIYDVTEGDPRGAGRAYVSAMPEEERASYWWVWLLAGFVGTALIALAVFAFVARPGGDSSNVPNDDSQTPSPTQENESGNEDAQGERGNEAPEGEGDGGGEPPKADNTEDAPTEQDDSAEPASMDESPEAAASEDEPADATTELGEKSNDELVDEALKSARNIGETYSLFLDGEKKKLDNLSAFASAFDKENLVAIDNLAESLRLYQERKGGDWDDYKEQLDRFQSEIESFDALYQEINNRLINKKASDKEVNDRIQADPNALGEQFKDLFKEIKPEESLISLLSDKIREIKYGGEKARRELDETIASIEKLDSNKVRSVLTNAFLSAVVSSKLIEANKMSVPGDKLEDMNIRKKATGSDEFSKRILPAFAEYVCKYDDSIKLDLSVKKGIKDDEVCAFGKKVNAGRYSYREANITLGKSKPMIVFRLYTPKNGIDGGLALFAEEEKEWENLLLTWRCEDNESDKYFLKESFESALGRLGKPLDQKGLEEYIEKCKRGEEVKPVCYMIARENQPLKQENPNNGVTTSFSMELRPKELENGNSVEKVILKYEWNKVNVEGSGLDLHYELESSQNLFKQGSDEDNGNSRRLAGFTAKGVWSPKSQVIRADGLEIDQDLSSDKSKGKDKEEAFYNFCKDFCNLKCEKLYEKKRSNDKNATRETMTLEEKWIWADMLRAKIIDDWNQKYAQGIFAFYEIDALQILNIRENGIEALKPNEILKLSEVPYNGINLDKVLYLQKFKEQDNKEEED